MKRMPPTGSAASCGGGELKSNGSNTANTGEGRTEAEKA